MPLTIENVTKAVTVDTATGYLNLPVQNGIDRAGHWYVYIPANAGNSGYGANVKIYQWSSNLDTGRADSTIQMNGTMALVREPWQSNDNNFYHGGVVENIGSGTNDITGTSEDDAFFFSHIGSLSPATDDDAFYWDRAYRATGTTDWEYYEYHKHLPSFYQTYESGRNVINGNGYIRPADKAYASMINVRVRVSGVNYQSVLVRIHTPSVGGAHNSHNDVTLPSVGNKNYQMSGILRGAGDRYHAFYITANGSDWDLLSRTYVDTSSSFSAEVNLGTIDLANPTLTTTNCHSYPVRASCGDYFATTSRIYFPVITNNVSSGFNLGVWSYTSLNTIASGTKLEYPLLSGVPVRPDMQILTVGQIIYGVVANTTSGNIELYEFDGATQNGPAAVVTNGSSKYLRIHGFRYNPQEVKFYLLVSGESDGTGNYTGPGMYTFNLAGVAFTGYKHLDFDTANNAFLVKNALATGYLQLTVANGTLTKYTTAEPQGIAEGTRILQYELLEPDYFNRSEITLKSTASEFIYQGIELQDNRKLLAGRVSGLTYGKGGSDLLFSIINQDNNLSEHYAYGGIEDGDIGGDDYVTGIYQSTANTSKIWFTGYTKSEMIRKRDIKIHGYCRNTSDAPNALEWRDIVVDTTGNIYVVGTTADEVINIFKYSPDYVIQWQQQLGYASDNITANKITIDRNGYLYIVGTNNDGSVLVAKLNSSGETVWVYSYEVSGQTKLGTGIAVVTKSSVEYLVVSAVEGTDTTFIILDTNGDIIEQNTVSNLVVERVRNLVSRSDGRFLFAGSDGSTSGKFGMGQVLNGTKMIQWVSTFGQTMYDIANIDGSITPGYIVCGRQDSGANTALLKVVESESAGVYTISKTWARKIQSANFYGLAVTPYTEATRYIFAVGKTPTGGSAAMGMDEGFMAKYDNNGTLLWQNVYGHDMDEQWNSVAIDYTGENIISAGWSESHSDNRDAIIFRSEMGGFGTGTYHLEGNAGVPYYYLKSTLTESNDANAITNLSAPADAAETFAKDNSKTFTNTDAGTLQRRFDGAYGKNGLFMMHFGYLNLDAVHEYTNSEEYKTNQAQGRLVNYPSSIFNFWQIATAGDGAADDGNVFGYDIIEASDGTVYMIGQTSGDLTKTNEGASGVYDYILVKFDPTTEEIEIYQNGTSLDEETYSLTEMSDGRIAFTGRTTGALGDPNEGGYDIFLGIYDPSNDTFQYESKGSGFNDRGLNVHDLGSGNLAIVYTTSGDIAGTGTNQPEDVGLIKFNYVANTWGTAYQTTSTASDLMDQNGKHSALLNDGRIAIVFSTGGIYDESGVTYGGLDVALAIWDPLTETFTRKQIGSQSTELVQSVSSKGDRLLIAGYISDTWGNSAQGIYVEVDSVRSFGGKEAAAAE